MATEQENISLVEELEISNKRGGQRKGAGRKPKGSLPRKSITIRLSVDLVKKLKESECSQADQIEKALRCFYGW
jgi:uncharacterized protein (DUF4415 family)